MPPYTQESNPDGTGRREREKAYKQRNSDGKNTFEGERTQSPPSFDLSEYSLPMPELTRITLSYYDAEQTIPTDRGAAIRHEHVFDENTSIDWETEP